MAQNQVLKTTRNRKAFQIYWEDETKRKFKELVENYDPLMPLGIAVLKLIQTAIKEWALPGYVRKEKPKKTTVTNKMAEDVIIVEDNS